MTLSVMDDLEFNTRYECVKCEKLEADLKTSKSEVAGLRNLVTVMRSQTAKTATLLQKFDSTKKTMVLQKQRLEALEKTNEILRAETNTLNEQLKKQLDCSEDPNSHLMAAENESLRNNIKSQETVIKQYQIRFKNLEEELEKAKKGKSDADKMCKSLQCKLSATSKELKVQKSGKQTDHGEIISKLKSEIGVLKRENTRLKDTREETVNRLADQKNQDITKKLNAMTNKQTTLENTIQKTIERTIQKNLKGFLETVTSPVKAAGSGVFRSPPTRRRKSTKSAEGVVNDTPGPSTATPPKKRGRPVGWKKNKRKPTASSDEDSELESLTRSKKSFKQPVKRKLSQPSEPVKKVKPLVKESGHLSNSCSSSDDDVDLVGQLEDTLRNETPAKNELEGVLVCDPLPSNSTASEFNIFDSSIMMPTATNAGNREESSGPQKTVRKPLRKVPTVLNVKSIFDVMASSVELSPLKTLQNKTDFVEVKSEDPLSSNSQPVTPTDTKEETPDQTNTSEPINQTTPNVAAETDMAIPHFQPISIKNEMKKTKSERDEPVITLKPISSRAARAAPIVSTLGDLLSPSKVKTDDLPSTVATSPDVEIVGVVNVEREEQSVSASDSQAEDDLPEVTVADPLRGLECKPVGIADQSACPKQEDHTASSANTLGQHCKSIDLQKPAQKVTDASPKTPKLRLPHLSMSFVKPKAKNLLHRKEVVLPDVLQKVGLPTTSTTASSVPDSATKLKDIEQTSLANDAVLLPAVSLLETASRSVSSPIDKDTESTGQLPSKTDKSPVFAENVQLTEEAPVPKTAKLEKSPCRRQSEVNVTLSGDSLVTPTTPTEVVVSEDVMVCAFEMDVGGVSSSQSDADTQSDCPGDVGILDNPKQAEQQEKDDEKQKNTARSRKSDGAPFVAPKRIRTTRSTSQDEQSETITKCLRSRKISFTEDSVEVPRRRRSARTSSVSDASDNNESPAPRRSRRIRNSSSPYTAVKAQKPKKSPRKKVPDSLPPEDMIIDSDILGAFDRNIMVPNDLLELKKAMELAQLQEDQIKSAVLVSAEHQNDSAVSLTDSTVLQPPESSKSADEATLDSSVKQITSNNDKSSHDNASTVVEKSFDENNGAKAVKGEKCNEDNIRRSSTGATFTEKEKDAPTAVLPPVKAVPPPSCNWHATKSLDLDLTPVSRKPATSVGATTTNSSDMSISSPSNPSDESYLEDSSLMIADAPVTNQNVVDVTTMDEGGTPSTAQTSPEIEHDESDEALTTEKENAVKVVAPPVSKWFATNPDHLIQQRAPLNAVATGSEILELKNSSTNLPDCRKRKKTRGPNHNTSLAQIFDLFIPKDSVTPLVLHGDNEHLVMDTSDSESQLPSAAALKTHSTSVVSVDVNLLDNLRKKVVVPTLPIDDEPLYHQTYEDYTHLIARGTTQYLVKMFRRNLCTSSPNVPYIVETILYNHKNRALQNVEEKLIRVIRNEISIRDTSPADVQIPPIDVLVEFFFDLFTQLMNTGNTYFDPGTWLQDVLKKLFVQISSLKKSISKSFQSFLSFSVKLSMKCGDLKYLRAYLINTINEMSFKYVCNLFTFCFSKYSIYLLIGEQHLSLHKDRNSMKEVNCLYLAGLEFYLRYTQLKFTPIEQLTYVHQFAVEHHLINAALDAVVLKEECEPGVEFKNLNQQGLICIKLMLKSQGWSWFTSTVLPIIFDKLASTTEHGICRLMELITALVTAEVISYRAASDIPMLKEKLIPALIGLLWTAPTADIKFSFVRCLVKLSPLNPTYVSTSLKNWINCIPQNFKEHCQYSEVCHMIESIIERQENSKQKSRTL